MPDNIAATKTDEHETGKIIGTFEAVYLGPVLVKEAKGVEVVSEASSRLLKSKKKLLSEGVFLQVCPLRHGRASGCL